MFTGKGDNDKRQDSGKSGGLGSQRMEEGFQAMEVNEEEDFETISAVKRDRAFDYRVPIDELDNSTFDVDPQSRKSQWLVPHTGAAFSVLVHSPQKRSDNLLDNYYEFKVTARLGGENPKDYEVTRRFSQFEELIELLKSNYPGAFLPHLPPKSLLKNTNIVDDKVFIANRTRSLDLMMKKLLSHHSLLGGSSPDAILMMFIDKNCELLQSSKVSKLTKNLVGSATLGYAKSKTYLKSWFSSSEKSSTLKYEYGGKEPDDLKELKEFFTQMKASLDQVLHDLGVIYDETNNKCQALDDQARTLENLTDNASLLSFVKINPEFTQVLGNNHRKTKERTEIYMKCLKEYFIFYFQELLMDVEEAISRIADRLLKGDQIKSNIHNIQSQDEIMNFWVAHRLNLEQLLTEVTLFKEQAKESLNHLLKSYKAAKAAHEAEILDLWQTAPKKEIQRAEVSLNDSTSDKNISMVTSP